MNTPDEPADKLRAAQEAAALVMSDTVVGLGSGTTASLVIRELGRRVKDEGLSIVGVPTSWQTEALARQCGIPLVDLDEVPALDIAIDGADEIDPNFQMIKGGGGALLREKIVAAVARRRVIVVTQRKCVQRLGTRVRVPVEVSVFGITHTVEALRRQGALPKIRYNSDGSRFETDEKNGIIDCHFPDITDPEALNSQLNALPGVFETGLFINLCDHLIVGHSTGVQHLHSPHAHVPVSEQ